MKLENIKRAAQRGFDVERQAKGDLEMRLVMMLSNWQQTAENDDWIYEQRDDIFYMFIPGYRYFHGMPTIRYRELTVSRQGVYLTMRYEHYDDKNQYVVFIKKDEVTGDGEKLLTALMDKRLMLTRKKLAAIGERAKTFLSSKEAEICAYPTVHMVERGNLGYRNYLIWHCNADENEAESYAKDENKEVRENVLQTTFGYSTREYLNEKEFVPCAFDKDEDVEKRFYLNEDIDLILTRHSAYHDDVCHYTPAIYASFVIKHRMGSFTPAFTAATYATKLHAERELMNHYREFIRDMESAEWTMEGSNAVAFVPVIWSDYREDILNLVKQSYPEDVFEFEAVDMVMPLFDDFFTFNGEKQTAIKVTVK